MTTYCFNKKLTSLMMILFCLLLAGCATEKFLGAKKIAGNAMYVERWFLNPEYDKKEIPKGVAFYGKSAEQIRHKFTIKYYINDKKYSTKEIPESDMWQVRHNDKPYYLQDDDNLFYYIKNEQGEFEKYWVSSKATQPVTVDEKLIPIKNCENGWCLLYPNALEKPMYVKQVILYKDEDI